MDVVTSADSYFEKKYSYFVAGTGWLKAHPLFSTFYPARTVRAG